MSRHFFSIIVPVYNVEKYLEECVNSILKQDYCDYEIILVDDGSTDSSGAICDSFRERCNAVKVIHKENGGSSDARNCGVRVSSGRYILFVDSDDYISDGSLKEIHKRIEMMDKSDVICLDGFDFYDNTDLNVPIKRGITSVVDDLRGDELYYYFGRLRKFPAAAWAKVIERDFFVSNNLFFDKGRLAEDLEWAVRLYSSATRISYCSVGYYHYRKNRPDSVSVTVSEKNYLHILDTVKKVVFLQNRRNQWPKNI